MTLDCDRIQQKPKVSLLIAMRNEERNIGGCLKSIFDQDYPIEKIEVFILDGLSTDNSWNVVDKLIRGRALYYLLKNPKIIQSAAWNLGIEKAQGEIIAIVSAHSILASDYVSKAVETYIRTNADLVGGPMTALGESRIAEVISLATSNPFGVGGARFHYTKKEEVVDTVYMGFCSRKLYTEIGGFDEEMIRNQDDELSYRIQKNGGKIICNPEIKSQYYNRNSFKSLWRQYYQYGLWKIRVLQKHPRQMRLRQFAPPLFVTSLLSATLLLLFPIPYPLSVIPLSLVLSVYLLANLVVSLMISARHGWWYMPLLPLTFAILHLSYGTGFLAGLVKFVDRWGDHAGKVPLFQPNLE